jgi:hypothetical protein
MNKLDILIGSYKAGTRSTELENEIGQILDVLHKDKLITKSEYNRIVKDLL